MLKEFAMRLGTVASMLGSLLLVAACGDENGDVGPNESPLVLAEVDGDGQAGTAGQQLGGELVVSVTRDGDPVQDMEVEWLTSSGGSFSPDTSLTDESGTAVTLWTLGPAEGQQFASARVVGEDGGTVRFSAEAVAATPPPPPGEPPPAARRPGR